MSFGHTYDKLPSVLRLELRPSCSCNWLRFRMKERLFLLLYVLIVDCTFSYNLQGGMSLAVSLDWPPFYPKAAEAVLPAWHHRSCASASLDAHGPHDMSPS